jgi:hypothetical protein
MRLTITYAFENIPSDRVILQHLVDKYCECWLERRDDYKVSTFESLSNPFLRLVMNRLRLLGKNQELASKSRCYLEHASPRERFGCRDLHMYHYCEKADFGCFERAGENT